VKVNYQNFDGIRGLAAIVVLMFHTAVKAGRPELMPVGYLAVDLFFALSGFVIAQAYGAKLHDGMGLRAFLAIRGRRLYPMFFLGQVLGFLVFAAAALVGVPGYTFGPLWIALGLGLLVLPVPVRGIGSAPPMLALNNPGWSLFFEVAINIAYALALPWLSRKVLWMLLGLGAVALLIAGVHWGDLLIGPTVKTFPGGLARVLFSFTAGVLLYEYRPRRTTFSNSISMAVLLATVVLLVFGVRAWWHDLAVVTVAFPLLVYLAARYQSHGMLARLSAWLGRVSYAIYILHLPVLYLVMIFVLPLFQMLGRFMPFGSLRWWRSSPPRI
jgi:peptidoglycan/LPS O-acetylase OafA/YrhL